MTWQATRAVMVRVGDVTPAGAVDELEHYGELRRTALRIGDGWHDRRNDDLVDVWHGHGAPS